MKRLLLLVISVGAVSAQAPNPTVRVASGQGAVENIGPAPVYRVTVVQRTTKAVNYRHRSGWTRVDLRGTVLAPDAKGHADVNSRQGYLEVKANMQKLRPATSYGPEYLTYVMWAITPEGRATNLGEVLLNGDDSKLDVTTELQAFGLIITAEPYFGVTQPSDVVVMENIIRTDTVGKIEEIDAKYELLQRGQYTLNVAPANLQPMAMDLKVPLELYEARNAVRIAGWTQADHYANDTFQKAARLLQQAEDYQIRKSGRKPVAMIAREAVQTAEDARIIAIKRMDDERLAQDQQAAADREAAARADAERAARQRAEAEEQQRLEAQRREQAETERASAERARQEAEAARAQAEADSAAAQAAKAAAIAEQQQARAEAERAREQANEADRLRQKAESDQTELRQQLLRQLNMILETRDTARGLIVNMSDVLFDSGRWSLRPGAREKLAKIAGIVLAHPGLILEVEGHTDSVGGDEYNQRLSERRAASVRDYLVQQGVNSSGITSKGFGKAQPVASNDSAAGRQRNRRVEMVVSGDLIGQQIGALKDNAQR